ncbi:hypothetical protein ACIREM_12430 [Streptomyces shenzhenensis]|uniref:hypothetical protein n=1 Tax=Streptomyces shenzhenensis TaxID=943815 RepID=UPI0037F4355B
METDEHCAALWAPIRAAGARRLASLIAPITDACTAAGTFRAVRSAQAVPTVTPMDGGTS